MTEEELEVGGFYEHRLGWIVAVVKIEKPRSGFHTVSYVYVTKPTWIHKNDNMTYGYGLKSFFEDFERLGEEKHDFNCSPFRLLITWYRSYFRL